MTKKQMRRRTAQGVSIASFGAAISVMPDDLVLRIFRAVEAHKDVLAYTLGAIIVGSLPRGTVTTWNDMLDCYSTYIREDNGMDPDLPGAPFVGHGETRAESIAQAAEHYWVALAATISA